MLLFDNWVFVNEDPEKDKIIEEHARYKAELDEKMIDWELKAEALDALV